MKKYIRRATFWAVAIAALVLFDALRAVADIVVDPNTPPCVATYSAHYTTIQAAVSAAASGATFIDAQVGVSGASGNTISGNTFRTVTTLTQ
jgi:hypothetical protein